MKNVLVLLHDDRGLNSRVQVALDLVRDLQGQLICLDLTIPIVAMGQDPLFCTMVLEPEVDTAVRVAAREHIEQSGVRFHWIERRGELTHELTRASDLADIIVLSSTAGLMLPEMHSAIGSLLVKSRKTVVVVPTTAVGMPLNSEAMLLWDGSDGAHHAMMAAMPLFRHATNVTIVEVDDGSITDSAVRASTYLSQRSVRNTVRSAPAFGERASTQLLEQLALLKPAYAAMGAFGTSRLVERLFGGVTERLVGQSPVPLLLAY